MWNKVEYQKDELVGDAYYLHDVVSTIKRRQAMFRCKCGNNFIAQVFKVKTLETKSCGCLHKINTSKANSKHNLKNHKLYSVWSSMKARCYNKNVDAYKRYGGIGVSVCEEWKNDFMSFYNWSISNGWGIGLQLDKDIKGNGLLYSPESCIYVKPKLNSNNRKTNKYIVYLGERKTISEWADYFNISLKNLYQRLSRGWSFDKCVNNG
jgi:hypothetical protein